MFKSKLHPQLNDSSKSISSEYLFVHCNFFLCLVIFKTLGITYVGHFVFYVNYFRTKKKHRESCKYQKNAMTRCRLS